MNITKSKPCSENVVLLKNEYQIEMPSLTEIYLKHKEKTMQFRSSSKHLKNQSPKIVIFPPIANNNSATSNQMVNSVKSTFSSESGHSGCKMRSQPTQTDTPLESKVYKSRYERYVNQQQQVSHRKLSTFGIASEESLDHTIEVECWEVDSDRSSMRSTSPQE